MKKQYSMNSKCVLLSRVVWFFLMSICAFAYALSRYLEPHPSGLGTHQQIGLPPCGFYTSTNIPCPGCGLTTSFAWMARFEIFEAAKANFWGVFLFLGLVLLFVLSLWGFYKKKAVLETLIDVHAEWALILLAILGVGHWISRIWL